MCIYLSNIEPFIRQPNYLYRCCDKVPNLSRKPLTFSLPNRLPTITIVYCFINHHKPTTLCFHGTIFGYVVAYLFTYTLVSADVLRNVPIIRYLHLSTTTHTFLVFYSLDCFYYPNQLGWEIPLHNINNKPLKH